MVSPAGRNNLERPQTKVLNLLKNENKDNKNSIMLNGENATDWLSRHLVVTALDTM